MFNIHNLKQIFFAALLITAVPALCLADDKGHARSKHGTRVDVGAHADFLPPSTASLRLVVVYLNNSSNPIEITEIKIFGPDGTLLTPSFPAAGFPNPPFDLEPFESKGFPLIAAGISPASFPPLGWFQVQASWKSKQGTASLKSWSVIIGSNTGSGVVSRSTQEGSDLPGGKKNDD
jgi:hypothetical protein